MDDMEKELVYYIAGNIIHNVMKKFKLCDHYRHILYATDDEKTL